MAGRNKKKASIQLPKLFQRGKKGYYYFRRRVDGKDKWINTKCTDPKEAEASATRILQAELSIEALSKLETSSHKLADAFVKEVTGREKSKVPLLEAHDKWIETIPHYNDLSQGVRDFHKTIFGRFREWCKDQGKESIEEINSVSALKYAKHLWEIGISAKTYNEHLAHLSRVFSGFEVMGSLVDKNPFDSRRVPRKKKSEMKTAGHEALEPAMLKTVIKESAKHRLRRIRKEKVSQNNLSGSSSTANLTEISVSYQSFSYLTFPR